MEASPATYAGIVQVLDTVDEASRKSMKEELLKTVEESKSQLNVETKAKKVIDENDVLRVDVKDKVDTSKETVSDSVKLRGWGHWGRGSAPRRSKVDPKLVQHWFRAREEDEASRNSREEPPLKKNKLEEGVGVKKPISFDLTEILAKHAERIADGTATHQFDYMSPKPWFPETIVNPYDACIKWKV